MPWVEMAALSSARPGPMARWISSRGMVRRMTAVGRLVVQAMERVLSMKDLLRSEAGSAGMSPILRREVLQRGPVPLVRVARRGPLFDTVEHVFRKKASDRV